MAGNTSIRVGLTIDGRRKFALAKSSVVGVRQGIDKFGPA